MILFLDNIEKEYVCTFDIEHDHGNILQFAGVLFKRIGDNLYQIARSINAYKKESEVSPFIASLTGLDAEFLNEVGVEEDEFKETISNLISGIDPNDVLFVSHGVTQDWSALKENGLVDPDFNYNKLCTYRMAKRVLNRDKNLRLSDIARECGYYVHNAHNAYDDAMATACILSFLTKIEEEGEQEK